MVKITGLSHLFKWENLHNWWLTKYFFAPLYIADIRMMKIMNILLIIKWSHVDVMRLSLSLGS